MRITQKDIARSLGVSLITVNRALSGNGYVSDDMKRRILTFAKDHNYIPHRASQVLVRNKIYRLALFSSVLPAYFWGDIRKGIEIAANQIRPFDYYVRYHTIPESGNEEYLQTLWNELEAGVNAVGLVNQSIYDMDSVFDLLERERIPYVTFNVDARERKRLCYIGSDYRAGGRLAAEVIGTALALKPGATVLVIASKKSEHRLPGRFDLNGERLDGFLELAASRFPNMNCDVRYIDAEMKPFLEVDRIEALLRERHGKVHAVYFIPAFNDVFLGIMERIGYRNTINVLHDLDGSAMRRLETHLLTAVIHQNPILQGYYAVKTLEHIVESGITEPIEDVGIVSNVVYSENRDLSINHLSLLR